MNKNIATYHELGEEKKRLQALLTVQKARIDADVQDIKDALHPYQKMLSLAGKIFSRSRDNFLLNLGIDLTIDKFFKKIFLARAGWLTRLLLPFFIKNLSSNILKEKLSDWIDQFLNKQKEEAEEESNSEPVMQE